MCYVIVAFPGHANLFKVVCENKETQVKRNEA